MTSDTFDDLRDLYQEVILDHGRHPRHAHRLDSFDATAKGDNPMCGDRIQVWVKLAPDGSIADTGFDARGCAISVASADLMAETVKGRNPADTRALFEAFREMARTGTCPACDGALAEPLMRRFGLESTARASFGIYTTHEEIDFLADALTRVREFVA